MTLADLLEKQFRPDLRFRGDGYFADDRVVIARVTTDRVYASVRDGHDYQTQLDRAEGTVSKHCTCEQFAKLGVCKHLWATVRAIDSGKLLTGAAKPGYVPPFVADEPAFDPMAGWQEVEAEPDDEIVLPHALAQTARAPSARGGNRSSKESAAAMESATAVAEPIEPAPPRRAWEQTLHSLRRELQEEQLQSGRSAAERQVFYEIDLPASRRHGQIVVQVSQRQRRASGTWGKLKPLKLRPGRFEELELEDDRTILAYLYGAAPDRSENGTIKSETAPTVYRYFVPQDLCERLLPLMCHTRRVRFLGMPQKAAKSTEKQSSPNWTPLEWDEGDPWELALEVIREEKPKNRSNGENVSNEDCVWQVKTTIIRGEEVLSPDDIRLLVPGGFVLTDESIGRLRDYCAFGWVKLLTDRSPIRVPGGEEEQLVDRLLDMPTLPRLVLPEQLQLEEVCVAPGKKLIIDSPSVKGRHMERLTGRVRFDYEGELISGFSDRWAIVRREEGRCLLRDRPAEEAAWTTLQDNGFRRFHRSFGHDQGQGKDGPEVEITAGDLGPSVRALIQDDWEVSAGGAPVMRPGDIGFRVKTGIDWFELHADITFVDQQGNAGSHGIGLPELLAAIARGETTVRLDDGSLGIIPEDWARQFGLLAGLGVADDEHMRFAPNQAALLDALLSAQESVEVDEPFAELSRKFRDFSGIEPCQEPEGFGGSLRTYQREGLGWLRFLAEFRLGGCLADDMGLGKTVQLLALLEHVKREQTERLPSLIVVPKSLMFNWKEECTRFTPDLEVLEYTGSDRAEMRRQFSEVDLVLTTYGTLRRDIVHIKDVPFQYAVLDEAQAIKNSASQVAKASRLLRAKHRIALSGTPIENHLGDLWSIFEFLNPGMLGRSSLFRASLVPKENAASGGDQNRRLLAQAVRPFMLRRTKMEVASDLPEKIEQTIHCDMTSEQRSLYNELRDHYRQSLLGMVKESGLAKNRMHVLEALLRLRQAACHPALLNHGKAMDESAKLDALVPQLQELIEEGHKALVFSQFTSMLGIVREHLDAANIRYEYLDGQTRDRKQRVTRFQEDDECGVFLISLKAGGLGLNLTSADYVFLLDPWWNPAVEAQAIDRAHRLGQQRNVFAYRMIVRDTVEEKIAELQTKKRQLAEGILSAEAGGLKDLSTEDLELLLS